MSLEERMAVVESENKRTKEDVDTLYKFIRDHMEKEERVTAGIQKSINEINILFSKQRSFVGGIVFTVSGVWAFFGGLFIYLTR